MTNNAHYLAVSELKVNNIYKVKRRLDGKGPPGPDGTATAAPLKQKRCLAVKHNILLNQRQSEAKY